MSDQPLPHNDPDIEPESIEHAINEPAGALPPPPELPPGAETLTEWDDAPASHGTSAPSVGPDDETNIAALLVAEGADVADRETRIAAADPDAEP